MIASRVSLNLCLASLSHSSRRRLGVVDVDISFAPILGRCLLTTSSSSSSHSSSLTSSSLVTSLDRDRGRCATKGLAWCNNNSNNNIGYFGRPDAQGRQYHTSIVLLSNVNSSKPQPPGGNKPNKNASPQKSNKITSPKVEEPLDLLSMVAKDLETTSAAGAAASAHEDEKEEEVAATTESKLVDEAELQKKKEEKLKKKQESKQRELTKKEIRDKQLEIQRKRNEKAQEKAQKTQIKKQQQKKKDDASSDEEE